MQRPARPADLSWFSRNLPVYSEIIAWAGRSVALVALLAVTLPVQAGEDDPQDSTVRPCPVLRVVDESFDRSRDSIQLTLEELSTPGMSPRPGLTLLHPSSADPLAGVDPLGSPLPKRLILLIHGLDDTGRTFNPLIDALHDSDPLRADPARERIGVAAFNYPNDQAIALSVESLSQTLEALRAQGVEQIDIIGHSMGGLVALDAAWLLSEPTLHSLGHIITIGTPYEGAPMAHLRRLGEVREVVLRWRRSPDARWTALFAGLDDGDGQAGRDLLPGSNYYANRQQDLPVSSAASPMIEVTSVLGRPLGTPAEPCDRSWWNPVRWTNRAWSGCVDLIGDGAVPDASALAAPTEDLVFVPDWHGLLASNPQTHAVVLERLGLGGVER